MLEKKKIWIDLDNSPHVPFFSPIIGELEKRGYPVLITARNRFQVCELAEQFHMNYKSIGRYYGKNIIIKLFWLTFRAIQLLPTVIKEKPNLALSHGSRSQIMVANLLRIPSVCILDYEYAKGIPFITYATYSIMPEIVFNNLTKNRRSRFSLSYPGIKEDVYIPYFKPDDNIINELGINRDNLIITIRPPATEAHYFRVESEKLFESAMDFLCALPNTQIVLLPRSEKQKEFVFRKFAPWTANGKIIIPRHTVEGLNLIWQSDLVISGGGTMNREAAALGVPVYSIFRGKIGAVDRYLSGEGRLTLIENEDDLHSKVVLVRRNQSYNPRNSNNNALQKIVSYIVNIIED